MLGAELLVMCLAASAILISPYSATAVDTTKAVATAKNANSSVRPDGPPCIRDTPEVPGLATMPPHLASAQRRATPDLVTVLRALTRTYARTIKPGLSTTRARK